MARDRANIRVDLWGDEDWRKLSMGAQHLYMLLLSHSTLNYAGVADWRTGRLAALTAGRTRSDVELDAKELQTAAFIYTDEDTEEVLIRSFLRHDGVIKHPRLHVSMANDFSCIASNDIKAYVAFELQKLHGEQPELALWKDERVQTILKATAKDLKADCMADAIVEPKAMPNPLPKDLNSDPMQTTTATATEAKASNRRSPKRPIPDDWTPNETHAAKAAEKYLDLDLTAQEFRNHALANDRRLQGWDAAFSNWLLKARPGTPQARRDVLDPRNW